MVGRHRSLITEVLMGVRPEVDHGVNLFRTVPQQPLQVAHESIDVSFAPCLQDYVLVIVVPAREES